MKKRNPIAVLALSYVTLGIYVVYWLYATRKEIVSQNGNEKSIPPVKSMYLPLLGLVLIGLLQLIVNGKPDGTASAVVVAINIISALGGIAAFVAVIYCSFRFMWRYCLAAHALAQGTDGKTLFWLWFIGSLFGLGPIAMLMIQSDLNRYIRDHNSTSLGQNQTPTPTPIAPSQDQPFNPVAPPKDQQQSQVPHNPVQDEHHQSRF